MLLHIHHYQLPWSANFSRAHSGRGALLALTIDGVTGYADLHPWTSLGDKTVEQQLELWKMGSTPPQLQQSLTYAMRDAKARGENRIGVHYRPELPNHRLLLNKELTVSLLHNLWPELSGMTKAVTAKWKISPERMKDSLEFLNEAAIIWPHLFWRLDANALFSFDQILEFWKQLSIAAQKQIGFIEDPCAYDRAAWNKLEQHGIPLAIDFEIARWQILSPQLSPTDSQRTTIVLKPAIQDMTWWRTWLLSHSHPFLLTSYLDHPVGLLHARWTAESLSHELPSISPVHGFNLPFSAEELQTLWPGLNAFGDGHFSWKGPIGSGIGFTEILESLTWIKVQ